jgi:hypothetical protein
VSPCSGGDDNGVDVAHPARRPLGRPARQVLANARAAILPRIQVCHTLAFTEATQKVAISITTGLETQGVDAASGTPKVRLSMNVENGGETRALVLMSWASYCGVENQDAVVEDLVAMGQQPNCGLTRTVDHASLIDAGAVLSDSLALLAPACKSRLIVGGPHRLRPRRPASDRLQTGFRPAYRRRPKTDRRQRNMRGRLVLASAGGVARQSLAHGPKYLMYADRNNDGGVNYWIATDTIG